MGLVNKNAMNADLHSSRSSGNYCLLLEIELRELHDSGTYTHMHPSFLAHKHVLSFTVR